MVGKIEADFYNQGFYHIFKEFGEIMFGLSYLPTAQRVSFSILRASNLKHEEIVENTEGFRKKKLTSNKHSEKIRVTYCLFRLRYLFQFLGYVVKTTYFLLF